MLYCWCLDVVKVCGVGFVFKLLIDLFLLNLYEWCIRVILGGMGCFYILMYFFLKLYE